VPAAEQRSQRVRDLERLLGDVVATVGVQLEGQDGIQGQTGTNLLHRPSLRRHQADPCNNAAMEPKARRLAAGCAELRNYIENNEGALIDYGERYRAGKPISTSRAEGTGN